MSCHWLKGTVLLNKVSVCDRLRQRDYPEWTIKQACYKVARLPRATLLRDKKCVDIEKEKNPIVFSPFSREHGKICDIIKRYLPVFLSDPAMQQIFTNGIRCVACRAPILGRTLSQFSTDYGRNTANVALYRLL